MPYSSLSWEGERLKSAIIFVCGTGVVNLQQFLKILVHDLEIALTVGGNEGLLGLFAGNGGF